MCITEEEFRELRKCAIGVLEEFKKLEASFEMEAFRLDVKTIKASRKVRGNAQKRKIRAKGHKAAEGFPELSLSDFFGDPDDGGFVIF